MPYKRSWLLLLALFVTSACGSDFEKGADLALQPSPTVITFGTIIVGESNSRVVTLTHSGTSGTLRLTPGALQSSSADFEVQGPEPLVLKPGESAQLTVIYSPSDKVYDIGQVVVGHNISKMAPLVLPIMTSPQKPRLSTIPGIIKFGDISAGSQKQMTVQVLNPGTAPLRIENIGLDLIQGAPFELTDVPQLPIDLPPTASFELSIIFAPPVSVDDRAFEARLRFMTDDAGTNNQYSLVTGRARVSMLTVKPGFLDFGWLAVGQSKTLDLQIRNEGSDPVIFESISLTEASLSLSLFGTPTKPGTMLQPFESLNVTARFKPTELVNSSDGLLGYIRIVSTDFVLSEREVAVHGRSAEPSLKIVPEEVVDFGIVGLGYRHKRTLRLINIGQAPLLVSKVLISEDSPTAFHVLDTPNFPVTLAPLGGAAEVTLGYLNSEYTDGESWGEVIVESNDTVWPQSKRTLKAGNSEVGSCIPRFEPPTVEFGAVGAGTKLQKSFKLLNDGSLPCRYKKVVFNDCVEPTGICQSKFAKSQVFSLGDNPPQEDTLLMFGDALEFPVWYEPSIESGEHAGLTVLTLINGAGDGPYMQYHSQAGGVLPSLHGSVGNSGIVTQPTTVKFALTTLGCGAKPADILAKRVGPLPIKLTAIKEANCDGQFNAIEVPPLPEMLGEIWGNATPFGLQFAPTKTGYSSCTFTLLPDLEGAGNAIITVSGFGTLVNTRTEHFVQAPESFVDILFVVDNSGSMQGEQEDLVKGFEGFVAQALTWSVKYQIGVITTDKQQGQGWLVGTPLYVTNLNPAPFKNSVLVGTFGSGVEQGLVTAWLALQPNMLSGSVQSCLADFQCDQNGPNYKCVLGKCGGPNRGFVRNEATLAIIWVSDENDQSISDVSEYVEFFQQLKGKDKIKGYAIVGDPPTPEQPDGGCNCEEPPIECLPVEEDPCGDGTCDADADETTMTCPKDCGTACGDGYCNGDEASANCPADCGCCCGDGVCDDTETIKTCGLDCGDQEELEEEMPPAPPEGTCSAKSGDRYIDAAESLGGSWYSICDFGKEDADQPKLLEQIGKDAFKPVSIFLLAQAPDPATIVVTVNDELCEEGWNYDAEAQSIVFGIESPCFPGPSAKITVVYSVICYPIGG